MIQALPTNYRGVGKWAVIANWMNRVGRLLNSMVGLDGIEIDLVGDEIRFRIDQTEDDSAGQSFSWGVSLTSSGASIGPGWVICGVRQPQQVSGQCVVSGGTRSSPTYAVLEYNYASGSATILSTTTAQYPVSEPGIFRCALHALALESGLPIHVMTHQAGDIIVPGFA